MRRLFVLLLAGLSLAPALAADRPSYSNARYGYALELPNGFSPIREAGNGDGGRSAAAAGHAELLVWGATLLAESFRSDVASRIDGDTFDGWEITYHREGAKGANWSGTRGERIFYTRGIPLCRDEAGYFRLEYDASAKEDTDAEVAALVKSFKRLPCD